MNYAGIAASAAIFTLLSTVAATAKPITTTGDTNLRKSPGTSSEVLTLIPKGTSVEVGNCTNGWCQVSLNGQDGYVIAQNLGMAARRASRRPADVEEEADEEIGPPVYGPGRAYVVGPPAYYGYGPYYYDYGPYYGFYGGWGYSRGWGRRW
jgi:uncharacterized protein YraI